MRDADFAALRDALAAARRDAKPVAANRVLAASSLPADLATACALQRAVLDTFGRCGAWKVAGVTPEQRRAMGVDAPVASAIPARFMRDAAVAAPVLDLAGFITPIIECEFAFRLAHDLPPRPGRPYARGEVEAAIGSMHGTIEIVDFRLPRGSGTLAEVADGFNNGALVVGEAVPDWRSLDLASVTIVLEHDAGSGWREVARGSARAVLDGNPFAAVVMLAGAQPAAGPGLRAGDVVTTGSCTGAPKLPGRGHYRARYSVADADIGSASVEIT